MIRISFFFTFFITILFYACQSPIANITYTDINAECIDFNIRHTYHYSHYDNCSDKVAAARLCIAVTPTDLYSFSGYEDPSQEPIHPLSVPVTDIRIITLNKLSDDYPAGSIANSAFGLFDASNYSEPIPWPDKGEKDAFITHVYFGPVPFIFAIRIPVNPGPAQFKVEFELGNGIVLSSLTQEITLY